MAGTVGAGGLGDLAIRYGYQRFEAELMWIIVAVLAVTIAVIQFAGDSGSRVLHRRTGKGGEPLRFRVLGGFLPGGPAAVEAAPAKTR
jgi:D-methionine transport system permease protein